MLLKVAIKYTGNNFISHTNFDAIYLSIILPQGLQTHLIFESDKGATRHFLGALAEVFVEDLFLDFTFFRLLFVFWDENEEIRYSFKVMTFFFKSFRTIF